MNDEVVALIIGKWLTSDSIILCQTGDENFKLNLRNLSVIYFLILFEYYFSFINR